MSLDINNLKNVVRRDDGSIVAQCPACAAKKNDLIGKNHLIIYPDGRFGCVLYPKGTGTSSKERKEHLASISRLVGSNAPMVKRDLGPVYGCILTPVNSSGYRKRY